MASDRAQILITAVDQTKAAFNAVRGHLDGLRGAATSLNGLLGTLGAALSVASLVAAGQAALNTADELSKLSQKTGLSVESLSLLKPVAEQAGTSMEGFAKGLAKLANSLVAAAGGAQEPATAFARLGVAVTSSTGQLRPTEAVLLDLADAFARMPDGAEQSALAMKLFGKSGVELIPFLNQGRAGIEQLKSQFKALGLEISGDTARAAETFNDTLDTVKQALSGIALRIAQAALPALQSLADGLVALVSHGDALMAGVRTLGELLVAVLAVKGVAAVSKLLESFNVAKLAIMRFLPVLAALTLWEIGKGLVQHVEGLRDAGRAIDDVRRETERLRESAQVLRELTEHGALSLTTQLTLAAQAAERLQAELPGTAEALRTIRGAATEVGAALRQAFESEAKTAGETVKRLGASYGQLAGDIKTAWDARTAAIEANYQRQTAAAQRAAGSEQAAITGSVERLVGAERDKLAAVEAGAQQMTAAWRRSYAQALALAQAAGQDVQAVERQALSARIAIYGQQEAAYRSTINRLLAEEQRHLDGARAADEARLNLRLSVEDRLRELSRKGMDEAAAYQDRQRQIDETQAQARAALAAGNFEQARKLAEESIALAERSAQAVTRQVEQNGKTITQTVVSEAQAAASAIADIQASALIADQALQGLGAAHNQAALAAGAGAATAQSALRAVTDELSKLKAQVLTQDTLTLEVDIEAARSGLDKLQALTEAQKLTAQIQLDSQSAEASLAKLTNDSQNKPLLLRAELDVRKVLTELETLSSGLKAAGVSLPALLSFEQPRAELASFTEDARRILSVPTAATHTPAPNLAPFRAAMAELTRPTSSTHTVYVRQVQSRALGGIIQAFSAGGQALREGFTRLSGRIIGPGTESSDSVPALLSHGEFVVRASRVRQFGQGFFEALNAGVLPALPRFAAGGFIGAPSTNANTSGNRDSIDLRIHIGEKAHTVQSSRDTAMQLANALRELSRAR